jgi:anti-anti-sigma factor
MSDSQESIVVATRRDAGRRAFVELSGELDLHSSPQLSAVVDDLLADTPSVVEIDASGLSFADSAGLRALLVAHNDAGQRGVTAAAEPGVRSARPAPGDDGPARRRSRASGLTRLRVSVSSLIDSAGAHVLAGHEGDTVAVAAQLVAVGDHIQDLADSVSRSASIDSPGAPRGRAHHHQEVASDLETSGARLRRRPAR